MKFYVEESIRGDGVKFTLEISDASLAALPTTILNRLNDLALAANTDQQASTYVLALLELAIYLDHHKRLVTPTKEAYYKQRDLDQQVMLAAAYKVAQTYLTDSLPGEYVRDLAHALQVPPPTTAHNATVKAQLDLAAQATQTLHNQLDSLTPDDTHDPIEDIITKLDDKDHL